MKIQLAVFLCLLVAVTSDDPQSESCPYPVKCPKIKPMKVVDFEKYGGIWEEYYHAKNVEYKCAEFNYQYKTGSPAQFNMTTDATHKDGKKFQGISEIKCDTTSCESPFMDYVEGDDTLGSSGSGYLPGQLDLFVLRTDYDTYTVEYGCSLKDGKLDQTLCVQARKGKKPPSLKELKKLLKENNIDQAIITKSCDTRD